MHNIVKYFIISLLQNTLDTWKFWNFNKWRDDEIFIDPRPPIGLDDPPIPFFQNISKKIFYKKNILQKKYFSKKIFSEKNIFEKNIFSKQFSKKISTENLKIFRKKSQHKH